MKYLGVDLAAKFSAGVITEKGKVHSDFDSWGMTQIEFVERCIQEALEHEVELLMVEDLPYGLSKQFQTKPATRLQGIFILAAYNAGIIDKLWFVNPVEWQKKFKINGKGPDAAREVAASANFEQRKPLEMYAADIPPLGKEHSKERQKVRTQLKKASTDYDDAFLISLWTELEYRAGTLFEYKGVQRYEP